MKKIKRDDLVVVTTGRDKGKTGKVLSVVENKVVIKGVNLRIKNVKPTRAGEKGKRDLIEFPIDISNVMYYDDKENSAMKVSFSIDNNGVKSRVFKKIKGKL